MIIQDRKPGKRRTTALGGEPTSHSGGVTQLDILPGRKPARKSTQIRRLWPQIRAALTAGHTIYEIRQVLAQDHLEIGYSKLRTYVAQLRRADKQTSACPAAPTVHAAAPLEETASEAQAPVHDPLTNLRERVGRRPGFDFDGRPPDEKELI